MRGPSLTPRRVAPHQLGQMTYSRAIPVGVRARVGARGRKSWPRVLSPKGRGEALSLPRLRTAPLLALRAHAKARSKQMDRVRSEQADGGEQKAQPSEPERQPR